MSKEKSKNKSTYSYTMKVNGKFESLDIEQEENVIDRNAILVKFYQERWRTKEEMVELLKKVIIILERDF